MPRKRKIGLVEGAVAEARRVQQGHLVSSEITSSHMVIQNHWGWMVRRCHPDEPEAPRFLNGRTPKLDEFVQSDRGINRMRLIQRQERLVADAKRASVHRLSQMRDRARAILADCGDDFDD